MIWPPVWNPNDHMQIQIIVIDVKGVRLKSFLFFCFNSVFQMKG